MSFEIGSTGQMRTLFENVGIEGVGYELPPQKASSAEIERMLEPLYGRLKLPEGRLELMTGIRERRLWPPGFKPSEAAALAGKNVLARTGFPKDRIGALLMCSVSRDFLEPATATVVHDALGLPEDAVVFDVSNACLGVLTGMIVVGNMIELGQIEAGMLVAGENSRPLMESTIAQLNRDERLTRQSIKPWFSSLTIGSGCVAVILSRKGTAPRRHRLLGGVSVSKTRYNGLCRGNEDKGMTQNSDTLMNTDSELLMRRGVEVAAETWAEFKGALGWDESTPDCFCTHQVGSAHRRLLFETLRIPPERDVRTFDIFGNVGSVSCPLTLAMALEQGRLSEGGKAALLGIGSGINCTMLGVEW